MRTLTMVLLSLSLLLTACSPDSSSSGGGGDEKQQAEDLEAARARVLDDVTPADFTVRTAPELLNGSDPWAAHMPEPQALDAALVAEGHTIPVARVAAMHEGKRRARAKRAAE